MTRPSFQHPPYDFRLAGELSPPDGWRVLFKGHFDVGLRCGRELPAEYGGDVGPSPSEELPVASWVLGRLAPLIGSPAAETSEWAHIDDGEVKIGLEALESAVPVAYLHMFLSREEVRLVGRIASGDLEGPISDALAAALLSQPTELAEVVLPLSPDVQLGVIGGKLLGSRSPELDIAPLIERIMDGEDVERLADDREQCCPITRETVLSEYMATSRPSRRQPAIKYMQSVKLQGESAWVFRMGSGADETYAVVREVRGHARLEWLG